VRVRCRPIVMRCDDVRRKKIGAFTWCNKPGDARMDQRGCGATNQGWMIYRLKISVKYKRNTICYVNRNFERTLKLQRIHPIILYLQYEYRHLYMIHVKLHVHVHVPPRTLSRYKMVSTCPFNGTLSINCKLVSTCPFNGTLSTVLLYH
jgi:hypothetical protein